MTRKDYVLIAEAIKAETDEWSTRDQSNAVYFVAKRLARQFQRDNTRFDTSRFMAACGFPATE
jgi:hypothetical protein